MRKHLWTKISNNISLALEKQGIISINEETAATSNTTNLPPGELVQKSGSAIMFSHATKPEKPN
jgi:hypothetical protein